MIAHERGPLPIQRCPAYIRIDVHENRTRTGHTADSASRWRRCVCGVATGAAVTRGRWWPLPGATPVFGMPHTARRRLGCALPSHPSPGVAPGPAIPCGKAKRRAGTGSSRSCAPMPNSPTASQSANGWSAASKRRSNRLPAQGSQVWERPEGEGPGVRKRARPRTRSSPSDCRVAPSPAFAFPAAPTVRDSEAQGLCAQQLPPSCRCARPERRGAHRHPMSFSRAHTVLTRGTAGAQITRWRTPKRVRTKRPAVSWCQPGKLVHAPG